MPEATIRSLRILLVSVEAPPSNTAEALQVGKLLSELRNQPDLIVDVLTAEAPAGSATDLAGLLAADQRAASSQVVQLHCRLRRWQRLLIRLLLPWLAHQPDWWFLFARRWQAALPSIRDRPDLVYSRSFPLSSTLAGYHLSRHFGVPWFLHLSDPWCEASIRGEVLSSRWHQRHESRCLQAAQRISFTSSTTLQRYCERYPLLRSRMVLDPNAYGDQIDAQSWAPSNRFRVVHTGSLTLGRWPDALIRALLSLPSDHPFLRDLCVIHAGPVDRHSASVFRQAGHWLQYSGLITQQEAARLQQSADLLLVIDYCFGSTRDAQYLPSKLTDYLAIRRPVLAITDRGSASANFITSQQIGRALTHDDGDGILAAFFDYWQAWKARDRARFELPPPDPVYSASQVAARIAADVRHLLHSQ